MSGEAGAGVREYRSKKEMPFKTKSAICLALIGGSLFPGCSPVKQREPINPEKARATNSLEGEDLRDAVEFKQGQEDAVKTPGDSLGWLQTSQENEGIEVEAPYQAPGNKTEELENFSLVEETEGVYSFTPSENTIVNLDFLNAFEGGMMADQYYPKNPVVAVYETAGNRYLIIDSDSLHRLGSFSVYGNEKSYGGNAEDVYNWLGQKGENVQILSDL